jgi:hypothetical protein
MQRVRSSTATSFFFSSPPCTNNTNGNLMTSMEAAATTKRLVLARFLPKILLLASLASFRDSIRVNYRLIRPERGEKPRQSGETRASSEKVSAALFGA